MVKKKSEQSRKENYNPSVSSMIISEEGLSATNIINIEHKNKLVR